MSEEAGKSAAGAGEISRDEAQGLIEAGAQLIDVRVEHEWDAGHIAGAKHLPLDELAGRVAEIDPERPVILYCRGDDRSTMATAALVDAGYDASKLAEGILGWAEAGLPIEPEDGFVAESGEAASVLEVKKKTAAQP